MSARDILAEVERSGITLEAHGDRLRFYPRSAVTPDLRERLRRHKHELLALLREHEADVTPRERDAWWWLPCLSREDRIAEVAYLRHYWRWN